MPERRIPAGIDTPGRVNTINSHIRLDAPDTPMDNHRRRLKTERRPKSDQGNHERPAEKVWGEAEG